MSDEFYKEKFYKPRVIINLYLLGNLTYRVFAIAGALPILLGLWFSLSSKFDALIIGLPIGVALIFFGWIQKQLIHGFAAGLELLFEIRNNTRPQVAGE